MKVAIIGAGMAGLSCAGRLREAGHEVRLFDKGRGPGGRMSTRRAATTLGEVRFDHGAPFFTFSSDAFRRECQDWERLGLIAKWTGVHLVEDETGQHEATGETLWVGTPAMNDIIRYLSGPFDVSWASRVSAIGAASGAWVLSLEDGGREGPFDAVLSAAPAEQAADLLAEVAPDIAEAARAITSEPCWTLMCVFDSSLNAGFDTLQINKGGDIGLAVRNSAKPGRAETEAWVVQASPEASDAFLEASQDDAARRLVDAFRSLTGAREPVYASAHRWRFARPANASPQGALFDPGAGLGACGDWLMGRGVEAAWLSGQALAEMVSEK